MVDLVKALTKQDLLEARTPAAMRKVVVETFGIYLLPLQVRAEWAAIIALALGPGPDLSAHFYFEGSAWKLHRLCESDGIGGAALLPPATLVAVVTVMQAAGKVVDIGQGRPPRS